MADEKPKPPSGATEGKPKFDPFKADTPVLPGVPVRAPGAATVAPKPGFTLDFKDPKILAGVGGAGLLLIVLLIWMFSGSSKPPAPVAEATPAPSAPAVDAATAKPASPPVAAGPPVVQVPGPAGTVEEFPQAWSVKKIFVRSATGRTPALIIRLPGGSPRNASTYWGLLLVSPYGRCELEYITNLKKIADDYGYRASHPVVVDPCNLTVFDPTRLGDVGGIVARGAVVQGTTLRPPLAMDLKIEGNRILILQTE